LATLTHQLGAAPRKEATNGQESAPVHITASVNIGDYNEFMEKFKGRNLDAFTASGIFYNAGTSKVHSHSRLSDWQQHRPVLCFVTRRFDFGSMDLELFTYYLCHVLESVWNSPYEIFIDVTAETSANEVIVEWVSNLLRGLPRHKVENCHMLYHYNVNTPYRRHLRTIFRHAKHVGFDMEQRSKFLRGLDDVQRYLDLTDVRLSENTIALEMQNALVFEPVWRIITREKRSAVSIKVGQESVQVIYVCLRLKRSNIQSDEQQVTSTSRTPLCDVIFAVDIDEINVSSYVGDENEFVLKGKGIRLVFSSQKRHDIIQVFNLFFCV
jgi:Divergent CRAL/TRIO domain